MCLSLAWYFAFVDLLSFAEESIYHNLLFIGNTSNLSELVPQVMETGKCFLTPIQLYTH